MQEMLKVNSYYNRLPKGLPPIGKTFNEYTPAELKLISDAEAWESYNFKVGDRHEIKLAGEVGLENLTGTWSAMIIGFNHNAEKEGKGITLQFVNNSLAEGNNLAFTSFVINNDNTNSGGWGQSPMRTKICTEFFNIMPKEWQRTVKTVTKYTDNKGNGSDNNPITATQDKIFIPAEFEVHGSRSYANSHEQSYQLQYDYYKAGNTKVKYQFKNTGTAVDWWVRSPYYSNRTNFCIVADSGNANSKTVGSVAGFAPCFVI